MHSLCAFIYLFCQQKDFNSAIFIPVPTFYLHPLVISLNQVKFLLWEALETVDQWTNYLQSYKPLLSR